MLMFKHIAFVDILSAQMYGLLSDVPEECDEVQCQQLKHLISNIKFVD